MVINEKRSKPIMYKFFIFAPNFNLGQKSATFHLVGRMEVGEVITSKVIAIHHLDDKVFVETMNSLYELDKEPKSVKKVMKYLQDPKLTSEDFYWKYVPNQLPTSKGWRIY